jgi:hypothetical protein
MTFSERIKELMEQGWAASKELAEKAGAKAQELGERSLIKLEIMQLEGQVRRLIGRLGNEVYAAFAERGQTVINCSDSEFETILAELAKAKSSIEVKEIELKNIKLSGT